MSKMTDEIIARMTPEQSARYEAMKGRSLASQIGQALTQQLERVEKARETPTMPRTELEMMLSGRQLRPTSNDHQTPHEMKKGPVVAPPGGGGMFTSKPNPWPPAGQEVAPRTADQAPRVTIISDDAIPLPNAEVRPVYRAAATLSVAEGIKAHMPAAKRAQFDAWQEKAAQTLQKRSDRLEQSAERLQEERQRHKP